MQPEIPLECYSLATLIAMFDDIEARAGVVADIAAAIRLKLGIAGPAPAPGLIWDPVGRQWQ